MSILTFLFFASVVYFASADPIAAVPKAPSDQDQDQMNSFIEAVSSAYDKYISTISIISSLSKGNSNYLKTTTMDGVASFMNYCMYTALQSEPGTLGSSDDNDFVLMQFDTQGSPSFPSVPYQEPAVPCQKEADS